MNDYLKLHKKLSRFDVEKDATKPYETCIKTPGGKHLFNHVANLMFGTRESYKELYKYLCDNIYNPNQDIITILDYDINDDINLFPPDINYCFEDTTVKSYMFNKKLDIILTPGTYIDMSNKSYSEYKWGFDLKLDENVFEELGIDYIDYFTGRIVNNIVNVELKIKDDDDIIKCDFNINLKKERKNNNITDNIYFSGNNKKNTWFNYSILSNNTNTNDLNDMYIKEAKKYILCKLLGDTLQAYYFKLYLHKIQKIDRKKYVLFTCDSILQLRCILLHVPCLYHMDKNNIIRTEYNSINKDMDKPFKDLYREMVSTHNQNNIKNIDSILNIGYFYLDNNKITINNVIKKYLTDIIDDIHAKNNYKDTIDIENVEEYRLEIFKYKAINLFHKKNDETYICYNQIVYLFPRMEDTHDIIFKENKNFKEIIYEYINFIGGNNMSIFNKDDYNLIAITNYNEYKKKLEEYRDTSLKDRIKLTLFYNLFKDNPNNKNIFLDLESMNNILFHYFNYKGSVNIDDGFIKDLIKLYKQNKLSKLSYSEFVDFEKEWFSRNFDEDKLFEMEFGKGIDNDNSSNFLKINKRKRINKTKIKKNCKYNIKNKTKKIIKNHFFDKNLWTTL